MNFNLQLDTKLIIFFFNEKKIDFILPEKSVSLEF